MWVCRWVAPNNTGSYDKSLYYRAGQKEPHLAGEMNSSAIPRVCSGPEAFFLLPDPSPEIPALEYVMSQVMMSKNLGQVPAETSTSQRLLIVNYIAGGHWHCLCMLRKTRMITSHQHMLLSCEQVEDTGGRCLPAPSSSLCWSSSRSRVRVCPGIPA